MDKIEWIVGDQEQGLRLDLFLSQKIAQLSRSGASQMIRKKVVIIANRQAKPSLVLNRGDKINYLPPEPMPAKLPAQNIDIEVVYQDEDCAVIYKPIGMVTHPAAGHADGTLVNALLYHLDQLSGIGGEQRPGIIHRLDKDTSGLLLVAKHDQAHHYLSEALQSRQIKRIYHALTWGIWSEPTLDIENYLGRDPKNRKRFTVLPRPGKLSKTSIKVIKQNEWCSLVECQLHTGRTHQIRVHCHAVNHPLLGDRLYGKRGEQTLLKQLGIERPKRQLLHAIKLSFPHPRLKKTLVFKVAPPDDFQKFIKSAKLN